MKEYPAAHSNDTEWFAVDEEGNIAYFDPRAEGATPTSFVYQKVAEAWSRLSEEEDILECRFDFPVEVFPELCKKPDSFIPSAMNWPRDEEYQNFFEVYMFLITDQEIIPRIARGVTSFYFPEISGTEASLLIVPVLYFEGIGDVVKDLIQAGKIIGVAGLDPHISYVEVFDHLPVFHYEPEGGGYIHPYERKDDPPDPVNIKDIQGDFPFPMEELPVSFTEQDRIQLMELGYDYESVNTFNYAGWVALDGKVYDYDGNLVDEG